MERVLTPVLVPVAGRSSAFCRFSADPSALLDGIIFRFPAIVLDVSRRGRAVADG